MIFLGVRLLCWVLLILKSFLVVLIIWLMLRGSCMLLLFFFLWLILWICFWLVRSCLYFLFKSDWMVGLLIIFWLYFRVFRVVVEFVLFIMLRWKCLLNLVLFKFMWLIFCFLMVILLRLFLLYMN